MQFFYTAMSQKHQFDPYDLGLLSDFEALVERLNQHHKQIQFRLAPLEPDSPFWVFEQILSDEESACAVVRIEKERVIAVGEDAFQFVSKVTRSSKIK